MIYCRKGCEIVFASEEERWQEGAVQRGKFVKEGDGDRWVFVAGGGKISRRHKLVEVTIDIKMSDIREYLRHKNISRPPRPYKLI